MHRRKLNCWEYQGCGRDRDSASGNGVCPASTNRSLHGSNGGSMAGRACWVVPGTLCEGCEQGTYEEKYSKFCRKCAFYYRVEVEEGIDYSTSEMLLDRYSDEVDELA
ncbi:MAG: hypothetical protein OEV43_03310 [Coriobacteriia bacterium]|nr:hypothetical protein [Coriobacteriia bacterium]